MERLIRKAIKGDEQAFIELLSFYREHLYRCAYYYLGTKDEALDAVQETAYKAYKARKSLKEDSNIKAWLTKILINYCRDYIKKKKKIIYFEDLSMITDKIIDINYSENIDKIMIYDALKSINYPYKDVIILRYIQDMKIKDISKIMNKSESTIKSWIYKGLSILKNILSEEDIKSGRYK